MVREMWDRVVSSSVMPQPASCACFARLQYSVLVAPLQCTKPLRIDAAQDGALRVMRRGDEQK